MCQNSINDFFSEVEVFKHYVCMVVNLEHCLQLTELKTEKLKDNHTKVQLQ